MAKTGFVFHENYLRHFTGELHPENSSRLVEIKSHLEKTGLISELVHVEPILADVKWIEKNHEKGYINHVKKACENDIRYLDADTGICKDSYNIALLAVGGALQVADKLMAGEINNAFCAVRPPGHHAEYDRAMGFCLFNNIAILARYLQHKHNLLKILIIDWDVHHGNGTQNSFYNDPGVFYFSIHQWPHYPGTGHESETGTGAGNGFTLNIPLNAGAGDKVYIKLFNDVLLPAATKFKPDFVLISAGFDAHIDDPLSGMALTEAGFAELTKILCEIANESCKGRIISLLEGGYNLYALARSIESHLKILKTN